MAERNLGDWLSYLEQLHPVKIDLGLTRVAEVGRRLGLVPFPAKVLTVAGTNGKGSVVYCCEAILRAAGCKTGRYTSPHLLHYNERIAVDDLCCGDHQILRAFEAIEAARKEISLSYFEFSTLAALWIFCAEKVDVAILEVGLGGRLDAVNIVDCDVAVVTQIDLDHQRWLGSTLSAIAPEKAAVARANKPVILAEASYPSTLFDTLSALGARVERAQEEWQWRESLEGLLELKLSTQASFWECPVPGGLRPANVAAAVCASAHVLQSDCQAQAASAALRSLQVPGRRQRVFLEDRELVLDVAHNAGAMQALVQYLKEHPVEGRSVAILGLMADKDLTAMSESLAAVVDGACALAIPGIDRAQSPERVWEALDLADVAIPQAEFSAQAVWDQVWQGCGVGDRIVVCGSFHSVAGILELLLERGVFSEAPGFNNDTAVAVGSVGS